MTVKQCVFIDSDLDAWMGIHCTEDNGDEYIIGLKSGDILSPSEIPCYEDVEEWDENWCDPAQRLNDFAEIAETLADIQNKIHDIIADFGVITISTKTGEITINGNDTPVYVILG